MDIEDIAPGLWPSLIGKWRRGKPIYREEIEAAFEEEGDIPADAKPLLRACMLESRAVELKRGQRSPFTPRQWLHLIGLVEFIRRDIEQYRKRGEDSLFREYPFLNEHIRDLASRQGGPLTLALEAVADRHENVSFEQLEQQRKRYRAAKKKQRQSADKT